MAAPRPLPRSAPPIDAIRTALALAAEHPSSLLPCPACAASVRGENLARHLERTHPGGGGEAPWPSRLRVEPGRITVRGRLGLTRRRVTLPAAAEIGGMSKGRPSAGMTSYADEFNVPHDRVPDGVYLRLTNGGSVTIACRTGTGVRRHWTGWTPGRRRQHAQIRLDAPAFVRLQYALAEQGVLTPRDAPAS